jgi:glycosyltransferase involved in cell wall biosynthesis
MSVEPGPALAGAPEQLARSSPATVLYVHHRPELGGAPTSLFHLLQALDRRRFRPVVLCPGGDAAALFREADVPVHRGPICAFTHVITCTYSGLRWAMLARELSRALPHARFIARRVREERAAVVHLNEGNLLIAALVGRASGARVVCHFRGMLADGHFGLRRRFIRHWLGHWADAVIAIDCGVAGPLQGLPCLKVIHNSVDLGRFAGADGRAFRQELGIPLDAPTAGMIGRVRADEGSLDFIHAAARLQASVPNAHFLLVGGGTRPPDFFRTPKGRLLLAGRVIRDELSDAQALAKRLGLSRVRFVPFRRDVPSAYAALDVVVTGGEAGVGRQALEAAAAGRPIIAASRRPVPDLLAEGETGYLIPPGSIDPLCDRLHSLLTQPGRRGAMGAAARRWAEEQFDPTANAARIMDLYDQLLSGRSAAE